MKAPLQAEMDAVNAEIASAMGADAAQLWSLLRQLGNLDLEEEARRADV